MSDVKASSNAIELVNWYLPFYPGLDHPTINNLIAIINFDTWYFNGLQCLFHSIVVLPAVYFNPGILLYKDQWLAT